MDNPFSYSGPVSGRNFCGREAELSRLEEAALGGGAAAVVGRPGGGISSLAAELERRLGERGQNVTRVELAPEVGPRAAREAVSSALARSGAAGRSGPGPGLLVDDAHRLAEDGHGELRRRLATAATGRGDFTLACLATRPSAVRDLVRSSGPERSGGAGEAAAPDPEGDVGRLPVSVSVGLDPIPAAAWLPFVLERFLDTDRWIANEHVEAAVSLTGGHPRTTQHLFHVLWSAVVAGRAVADGDVEEAFRVVLGRETACLEARLEALTPNQRRTLAGIAREGPEVEPFSSRFVRRNELASPASVQRALQALRRADLVDTAREGEGDGGLRVTDPLLEALLRRRPPPVPRDRPGRAP